MNSTAQTKHFLLVGNGAYLNRGCEAIVRGTMAILRRHFGEPFRVTLGTYETSDIVGAQAARETDPLITHVSLCGEQTHRWSRAWWRRQLAAHWVPAPSLSTDYPMLDRFCQDAACVLQVGGDNYSLDYGRPLPFLALDDYFHQHHIPVILWGGSVGPFEADPPFAPEMFAHLRGMRAIILRESGSYDYLKEHGVDANLHRMSDPAFAMEPVKPPPEKIGCDLPPDAIGVNLSPLMAKYVTGGDRDAWVALGAEILQNIVSVTQRPVVLVPHVTWASSNDHAFLRDVAAACAKARIGNVGVPGRHTLCG